LERREELAELIRHLKSLPESQRAAIVMRELEGLSHEEIATALGLSGGAARQAIYRARQTLRDGFGILLPLPVLKVLAGSGSSPVEAAAGAAGAGGAGVALKAMTATALVAGALGAGAVINHGHRHESSDAAGEARTHGGDSPRIGIATAGLRSAPESGAFTRSRQGTGSSGPGHRHDGKEPLGSTEQGGRGENPGSAPEKKDGEHGGNQVTEPSSGDGPSGQNNGPSSGDSTDSSSGPGDNGGNSGSGEGGDDSSGPSNELNLPAGEETTSGDGTGSNSGPDSGDSGAGGASGTDDLRDPHGAGVFSVQETQP